jgi:hypothetical protein
MNIPNNKKDYICRLIAGVRQQIEKDPDTIKAYNDCGDYVTIARWIDASILCDVIEDYFISKSNESFLMRKMEFDDGRVGWYIDNKDFYCDIEPDENGKLSVFFRDRKSGKEVFKEYNDNKSN